MKKEASNDDKIEVIAGKFSELLSHFEGHEQIGIIYTVFLVSALKLSVPKEHRFTKKEKELIVKIMEKTGIEVSEDISEYIFGVLGDKDSTNDCLKNTRAILSPESSDVGCLGVILNYISIVYVLSYLLTGEIIAENEEKLYKLFAPSFVSLEIRNGMLKTWEDISNETGERVGQAENGCIVCVLGGEHRDLWSLSQCENEFVATMCAPTVWAQKLDIYKCNIPLDTAKLLFELYNRYAEEYKNAIEEDENTLYAGLDNLSYEILDSREKMRNEMNKDCDYSFGSGSEEDLELVDYIKKMIKKEPERYSSVKKYVVDCDEDAYIELEGIFAKYSIECSSYYWKDRERISQAEWDEEFYRGFRHWYDILELYSSDKPLPFNLEDENVFNIFGYGKFEAFADNSYGC